MKKILVLFFLIIVLSGCELLNSKRSILSSDTEVQPVESVPMAVDGLSIYHHYHSYTFIMQIDETVTFENINRESNTTSGKRSKQDIIGKQCQMRRNVNALTRDILIVKDKLRNFRLIRSVDTEQKKARPILLAIDLKTGSNTFEIYCPSIEQYTTTYLEQIFGFKIIATKNKLTDNFI